MRRAIGPLRQYQLKYFYALMHVIFLKEFQIIFFKNFKVHGDRAFYYKGPWSVFYRGREIGRGEIMCFNKRQVAAEIQRQLHFWCVEYLDE